MTNGNCFIIQNKNDVNKLKQTPSVEKWAHPFDKARTVNCALMVKTLEYIISERFVRLNEDIIYEI